MERQIFQTQQNHKMSQKHKDLEQKLYDTVLKT